MWHVAVLGHERVEFKLGCGMLQRWGMSEQGLSLGVACVSIGHERARFKLGCGMWHAAVLGHERAGFKLRCGMWQCWGMSEKGLSLGVACGIVAS